LNVNDTVIEEWSLPSPICTENTPEAELGAIPPEHETY
jgi:hypothetical protein